MAANEQETAEAYGELIRYVVASLLGDDTDFQIETEQEGSKVRVEIHTPDEVRGRVIGRGGRIARAMRSMASAADIGVDTTVSVDIVD